MIDITEQFNREKDNWVAEVLLDEKLRKQFPNEYFQVVIDEPNNSILITDLRFNKTIIIEGDTDAPTIKVDDDGQNFRYLKQAAAYLISTTQEYKKQREELSSIFGDIFK